MNYTRSPSGEILIPPKAQRICEFVEDYHAAAGYGPTYAEIVKATPYHSKSAISRHVRRLAALGLLEHTPGVARSARPPREPQAGG